MQHNLIEAIRSKQWYRHGIYRDTFVFAVEVALGLSKTFFAKEDIPEGVEHYAQLNSEVFVVEEEFKEMEKLYYDHIANDPHYIHWYLETYRADLANCLKECARFATFNYSKLPKKELAVLYGEFVLSIRELHHWLWSMEFFNSAFDWYVRDVLKTNYTDWSQSEIDAFLKDISYINVLLPFQEEEKAIISNDNINTVSPLYQKYAWMNMHLLDGEPYTLDQYKQHAREIFAKRKEIAKRLKENEQLAALAVKKTALCPEKIQKLLRFVQELIYLKTYRIDVYTLAAYKSLELRREITKRLHLTLCELNQLELAEVVKLLQGKNIAKGLTQRDKYAVVKIDDELTITFDCSEISEIRAALEKPVASGHVKGNTAHGGKVRGKARVILTDREIHKVQQGEILVCNLTNPDYNPVFDKIAGLITDEGGILCHSAIMAREFKIPCIIGTKNATYAIKDGDEIELDADAGIARILDPKK